MKRFRANAISVAGWPKSFEWAANMMKPDSTKKKSTPEQPAIDCLRQEIPVLSRKNTTE
jgi:hypothetical protein